MLLVRRGCRPSSVSSSLSSSLSSSILLPSSASLLPTYAAVTPPHASSSSSPSSCQRGMSTTTNPPSTPPSTPPPAPLHSLAFEPVNPAVEYRESMRQLRRKYAEEQAELRQQQTLLSRQRFQEKKLQQEKLRQDIIAYKRQQQIKGLDLTVGGVDSVALVVEDKEKGEQGVNNTSSSSFDRLIESRRSTWHRLKKQVREARLDTHLSLLQETSLARQEQLLYLFYSASDFVTLDNLDAKLDQVVAESAQPSHTHSYFPANLDIMQSSLTSKSASEKAKEVDGLVQELKETLSGSEDTAKPDLLQLERKREELEEENEL